MIIRTVFPGIYQYIHVTASIQGHLPMALLSSRARTRQTGRVVVHAGGLVLEGRVMGRRTSTSALLTPAQHAGQSLQVPPCLVHCTLPTRLAQPCSIVLVVPLPTLGHGPHSTHASCLPSLLGPKGPAV